MVAEACIGQNFNRQDLEGAGGWWGGHPPSGLGIWMGLAAKIVKSRNFFFFEAPSKNFITGFQVKNH